MSKICIFSAQYLPHLGGVERYTENLVRHLKKRGDTVVIVTSKMPGTSSMEIVEDILVLRVDCWSFMDGRYPVLKWNHNTKRIHKKLMEQTFDLVLINTRFYLHSVYGAWFAKKQKARCIMIEHGSGHMTVHNQIGDMAEQLVEHTLTWIDKRLCHEFYGVSQACGEWLKHFHIQAKGTLYNAIDDENVKQIRKGKLKDFRKEYQIPCESTVITFTGRLLKEKGIYQLMESVESLIKEGNDLYLILAGDGDELEGITKRSSERIIAAGRLPFEEIVALLEQTDIFCLPSDSEGFSTSVLEAIACECYVITTAQGGSKEIITSEEYGMILPDNKVETVTEGLRKVLPEKEYRQDAIKKTYKKLVENYTWKIVAEQVHDLAERK